MPNLFRYISFIGALRKLKKAYAYHKIDKSDVIAVSVGRLKSIVDDINDMHECRRDGTKIASKFSNIGEVIRICKILVKSLTVNDTAARRLKDSCTIQGLVLYTSRREFYVIDSYYVNSELAVNELVEELTKLYSLVATNIGDDYRRYYDVRLTPLCDELEKLVTQL